MFLLDSNILIYHLAGEPTVTRFLNEKEIKNCAISTVSVMELLAKPDLEESSITVIKNFLEQFATIELTDEIAKEAAALKRKYNIQFPDAVIGATAKLYGLKLVSKDKIFSKIKEIRQSSLDETE